MTSRQAETQSHIEMQARQTAGQSADAADARPLHSLTLRIVAVVSACVSLDLRVPDAAVISHYRCSRCCCCCDLSLPLHLLLLLLSLLLLLLLLLEVEELLTNRSVCPSQA